MVFISYAFYAWLILFFEIPSKSDCRLTPPQFVTTFLNKYDFTFFRRMTEKTPKEWVDHLVKTHKVVVFSKSYCPYCTRAKEALGKLKLDDVHVEELDGNPKMDEVQDYLNQLTGARSVPRVFVNGHFYGDSSKTVADVENGTLLAHLKKTDL